MKKIYLLLLILILPLFGFSQQNYWKKIDASKINASQLLDRTSTPSMFEIYNLQFEELKTQLSTAISRKRNLESNTIIKFPNVNGKIERYKIYEASVMEENFAEKHPQIQSYVGVNIDSPGTTMRFSTTIFGFHAAIYSTEKTVYIDPYSSDLNNYIIYSREGLTSDIERMGCQFTDDMNLGNRTNDAAEVSQQRNANDGLLRTFRLSLSSTQEYSNFHIDAAGQQGASDLVKRQTVLAAMSVTMTRVNGIFERDLSVTMEIIEIIDPPFSNISTISLVEPDGFTDSDANQLITQNQTITDNRIGRPNYDVGHVFTTGGGGVASLGFICVDINNGGVDGKARAVTGLPSPVGDPYDVDFVAHEMGHHFGANHSYNGGDGNCGAQRNAGTAVETGSGNTIMGYAGICASDNVQPNSDDHFHAVSIDEIYSRLTASGSFAPFPVCSTNTPNGNAAPIITPTPDYTIPFGTAFTLTGTAVDPDGGTLTYNWEQVDTGTTTEKPNLTSTTNPQFKSFPSTASPDRTFPQLSDILAGNLAWTWEAIPNVARTMDFALTVRDNQSPNGGQTNRDDMTVTTANVGPFRITAPDMANASFPSGSSTTINWDVAGTTTAAGNGINTDNVNILFSQDGGQTFSTLVANTPNDGTQSVTFPAVQEPFCRIKIEAVGNIFFAMSKSFSVGATVTENTVCNTYTTGPISTAIPDGTGSPGQGAPLFVPVTVTESNAITDIKVSVDVTHSYIGDLLMQLQAPSGGGISNIWSTTCSSAAFQNLDITFEDRALGIACASPTTGVANPANPMTGFLGNNPQGTWNLVFVDFFTGDTGVVNEWSIELCTTTQSIVLGNEDFEVEDFALFPNPNKGDFTLQFNSNSGQDINIDVYDITGKLVFNNSYDATSRFDKQIALNDVNTGIYILKANDGDKTITRKLIIE